MSGSFSTPYNFNFQIFFAYPISCRAKLASVPE
jgi:hypothetical protein